MPGRKVGRGGRMGLQGEAHSTGLLGRRMGCVLWLGCSGMGQEPRRVRQRGIQLSGVEGLGGQGLEVELGC